MHELVTRSQVGRLFDLLALITPVIGAIVAFKGMQANAKGRLRVIAGVIISAAGPLNWLLWHVYRATTSIYGLDTVKNVVINFSIFIVLGLLSGSIIGVAIRRSVKRGASEEITDTPPKTEPQ